ncbi:hypothetical protein B7P33_05805 [Sediminicola luteus]|uniref:Uncharacterized protein n=1 Tax=Sediminicola luteus TaxID=319238 RepID=A0A2A4G9N0_9FLAO|nr:hypothetical protein B7P33_05805 [Sediminicola luteus]
MGLADTNFTNSTKAHVYSEARFSAENRVVTQSFTEKAQRFTEFVSQLINSTIQQTSLELWGILVYEDLNILLESPHPDLLLPPFRGTGAREGVLNDFVYFGTLEFR